MLVGKDVKRKYVLGQRKDKMNRQKSVNIVSFVQHFHFQANDSSKKLITLKNSDKYRGFIENNQTNLVILNNINTNLKMI